MDHVEAFALVPPLSVSVMLDWPLVTSEVRMFSMEVAVRAQDWKALVKAPATSVPVVSNMFAGKLVRLEQLRQALSKLVPAAVLINGKLVRLEQLCQA